MAAPARARDSRPDCRRRRDGRGRAGSGAARAGLLGAKILAYDPREADRSARPSAVEWVDLATLFAKSEIVTLHCPAPARRTPDDRRPTQFATSGAALLLVNTARAALVDEAALLDALQSGQVDALCDRCLRTRSRRATSTLVGHDRVIAVSHIGGYTEESVERATTAAVVATFSNALGAGAVTVRAPRGRLPRAAWRRVSRPPARSDARLYWLGQAGFVIEIGGRRIVIDPYLSDTLAAKYAQHAAIRTERMSPAARRPPDELGALDLVLCTHHHTDHMDPGTLAPLARRLRRAALRRPRGVGGSCARARRGRRRTPPLRWTPERPSSRSPACASRRCLPRTRRSSATSPGAVGFSATRSPSAGRQFSIPAIACHIPAKSRT